MDKITSIISDASLKDYGVAVAVISGIYLTTKGLQHIVFRKPYPYPPGPPRYPLIGAMRSFPSGFPLTRFNEWAATYGDIVYAPVPGKNIVILNSYEAAQDLLSGRASTTSGRDLTYLAGTLIGWEWLLSMMPAGARHSNQRKMLRRAIGSQSVRSLDPLIESETAKFVTVMQNFQGDPDKEVHNYIGRLISIATYGNQTYNEIGDGLSKWNEGLASNFVESVFSTWLVDTFHFLRFIPDWIPGLRFKQLVQEGKEISDNIRYKPYRRGLELYKSGILDHSILATLLDEFGENTDVQDATAVLYAAGFDTTSAGIMSFLYMLFLLPEVAERIHEEIEGVTQGLRLPRITDRSQLPYTEAVWKEAIRWHPFNSLGLPHVSSQEEVVKGYLIPKGAIIYHNITMMLIDPKVWRDPEAFRPERFLEPAASQLPNPLSAIFGWGSRGCPGNYLADRLVFHTVATIVSLYKLVPREGNTLLGLANAKYTDTLVKDPIGFECRFVLRNQAAESLLRSISLSR